jgi:hypothetical protein
MKRPIRWIFASDLHGHHQNVRAVQVLKDVTRDFKADLRIYGGDLLDLAALRKGATADEQCENLQDDWNAGMEFLHSWRPTKLLLGNHDERIYTLAESSTAGIKAEYAGRLVNELENTLRKLRCEWKPYHKRLGIFSFGNLNFLHGYFSGVSAAKQHAMAYGNCVYGHCHATDSASFGTFNERKTAYGVGGLLNVDQPYNSRYPGTLRHGCGFAMGLIHEDGSFNVHQVQEINGRWHVPTGFKSF